MTSLRRLRRIPPSPAVLAELFDAYKRTGLSRKISFTEYLKIIGFTDPSISIEGMDDGLRITRSAGGPLMFAIPEKKVTGNMTLLVLLVDFPDRPGTRTPDSYRSMLFSTGQYPTGSLLDYYREVSGGKVTVNGAVHGWLRMPEPYSYYVANGSGVEAPAHYPGNAQGLAEDAVKAAITANVPFPPTLDLFGDGNVTALFIVHAGLGAESLPPAQAKREIWSHKWFMPNPIALPGGLVASTYLTVPQQCKLGVCAHELGHLAFQWEDFYDANYNEDGQFWDGSGSWDLMAGGSYNGSELTPAHPAGLHKLQHGWINVEDVGPKKGTTKVTLPPYTATGGKVVRVRSARYKKSQYLILENRQKSGFDFSLPGNGLLVWRVDEDRVNTGPAAAGLFLVQADGKNELGNPNDFNQGDGGDPFPGDTGRTSLGSSGALSTSFGSTSSGITISQIAQKTNGSITFSVTIAG
jgi:immune inhibitor A